MNPTSAHLSRRVVSAALLMFVMTSALAEPPPLDHAWELTSQMRPREAAEVFVSLAASGSREAAFGAALTHLQLQPFTAERLAEARQQLQALADANRDDETGIRARFLLGRIRQLYDSTAASVDASELVQLSRDHPAHYLGQLGVVKLVLHRLYAPGPSNLDAARLTEAEQVATRISDPGLQRDYHIAMGDAYLYFNDQRVPALRHYRAAEALGIPDSATRATVLVQIGELARLGDQPSVAAAAYRKFLGEFRRDIRCFEVRKRLAALGVPP